jgi:hypothetical protein
MAEDMQPEMAEPAEDVPPTVPTPDATPSGAAPAGDASSAVIEPPAAVPTASARNRRLGATGQVAGVVGIVVCLVLVAGVILARNWLVDGVDQVAGAVDTALGAGTTLIDTASTKVGDVSDRVGAVDDAANAIATNPNPVPAFSDAVTTRLAPLSDRYLAFRTSYAELRERLVSALDRLQLLDRLLPFFSLPPGFGDRLAQINSRAQELDAVVMGLMEMTPGAGAANAFGAAVAAQTAKVGTALDGVVAGLDQFKGNVETLQTDVRTAADRVNLAITLAALVMIVLLLYLAFLNLVLYRSAEGLRRGPPATDAQAEDGRRS